MAPAGQRGSVDIDPSDGGREFSASSDVVPPPLPTVLTKLEKWGNYESMGDVVATTKFVPMKTPLSDEILRCWSLPEAPRHRLTVDDLLLTQSRLGRRVGMILDLSNHDCLYTGDLPPKAAAAALALLTNGEPAAGGGHERRSSSGRSSSGGGGGAGSPSPSPPCSGVRAAPEFQELQYQHIKLVAKELPAPEFVSEVCRVADAFWAEQPTQYIAIHCAYGFNRTGFVVCCYLVERRGMTVDQALAAFGAARPPGVKHEQFRAELRARYEPHGSGGQQAGASPPAPSQPDEEEASPAPPGQQGQRAWQHQQQQQLQHQQQAGAGPGGGALPWSSPPGGSTPFQAAEAGGPEGNRTQSLQVFASFQRECLATPATPLVGQQQSQQQSQQQQAEALVPAAALSSGGMARLNTPMSENDSLGFTDRMALQTLRAQHLAATAGTTPAGVSSKLVPALDGVAEHSPPHPGSQTPAGPASRLLQEGESSASSPQSICTPKSVSAGGRASMLGRKSISEIVWSTDDDPQQAQPQSQQSALEGRRSGTRGAQGGSAGGAPSALGWGTPTQPHRGSAAGAKPSPSPPRHHHQQQQHQQQQSPSAAQPLNADAPAPGVCNGVLPTVQGSTFKAAAAALEQQQQQQQAQEQAEGTGGTGGDATALASGLSALHVRAQR